MNFVKIRRDLFPVISKTDNFKLEVKKQQAKEDIAERIGLPLETVQQLEREK